jgi:hypothetical protein
MQTLSRYFVAFLLLLVTNFLGDSKAENENSQVYRHQTEIQKASKEKTILEYRTISCS